MRVASSGGEYGLETSGSLRLNPGAIPATTPDPETTSARNTARASRPTRIHPTRSDGSFARHPGARVRIDFSALRYASSEACFARSACLPVLLRQSFIRPRPLYHHSPALRPGVPKLAEKTIAD